MIKAAAMTWNRLTLLANRDSVITSTFWLIQGMVMGLSSFNYAFASRAVDQQKLACTNCM
jgi:hypothetical protein